MLWISLLTWFKGSLIGQDSFGNKYYEIKGPETTNMRRWVVYKGSPEASKVPAEWHGWLHHQALTPPHPLVQKGGHGKKSTFPIFQGQPMVIILQTLITQQSGLSNPMKFGNHKGKNENQYT